MSQMACDADLWVVVFGLGNVDFPPTYSSSHIDMTIQRKEPLRNTLFFLWNSFPYYQSKTKGDEHLDRAKVKNSMTFEY